MTDKIQLLNITKIAKSSLIRFLKNIMIEYHKFSILNLKFSFPSLARLPLAGINR